MTDLFVRFRDNHEFRIMGSTHLRRTFWKSCEAPRDEDDPKSVGIIFDVSITQPKIRESNQKQPT